MMLFTALFALTAAASTLAAPFANYTRCGNAISSDELRAVEAQFAVDSAAALAKDDSLIPIPAPQERTIHVVWHIIQESNNLSGGAISDDAVRQSISAMNKHYIGSTFNFVLDKIDRTTNSNWFRSATSGSPLQTAMKKALHTGDAKVLNVYTVGFKGSGLLGYATWPWDYSKNPVDDGVVILYSSIPGGSTTNFNEGKTLTHEVGHWLGVYHVFDDLQRSCDDTDYVSDTPAQKTPTNGCPTSKDSCPTKPGLDSIHNYMDYSYDPCMNAFTPGQIDRMKKQSFTYRGLVATSLVSTPAATLDTVLVPASPIPPPETL
ncbi:hypothetical protein FRC19_003038 [Serendipita sp. 401]|nr:hypothetical protein FRC19_003038 [Serendipita sp. 401]